MLKGKLSMRRICLFAAMVFGLSACANNESSKSFRSAPAKEKERADLMPRSCDSEIPNGFSALSEDEAKNIFVHPRVELVYTGENRVMGIYDVFDASGRYDRLGGRAVRSGSYELRGAMLIMTLDNPPEFRTHTRRVLLHSSDGGDQLYIYVCGSAEPPVAAEFVIRE